MTLLTLAMAKAQLRLPDPDDTSEDGLIALYIAAAEAHVVTYLGGPVPEAGLAACTLAALLYVSDFYDNRGANMEIRGALVKNPAAEMLLFPHRMNLGI